jgi:hypothetical protein
MVDVDKVIDRNIEDSISKSLFSGQSDKTFVDKLFAKDDVNKIEALIQKPHLTRSELLRLLYLISATEAKLVNYSSWDRYVILKFFVWIREFIKVAELVYDYEDWLEKQEGQEIPNTIVVSNYLKCDIFQEVEVVSKDGVKSFKNTLEDNVVVVDPMIISRTVLMNKSKKKFIAKMFSKKEVDNFEKVNKYFVKVDYVIPASYKFALTDRTKKLLNNCGRLVEHNAKFLIDLYLNIARTTLSLGATGFTEVLKNKYEVSYPQGSGLNTQVGNNSNILGFGR